MIQRYFSKTKLYSLNFLSFFHEYDSQTVKTDDFEFDVDLDRGLLDVQVSFNGGEAVGYIIGVAYAGLLVIVYDTKVCPVRLLAELDLNLRVLD